MVLLNPYAIPVSLGVSSRQVSWTGRIRSVVESEDGNAEVESAGCNECLGSGSFREFI